MLKTISAISLLASSLLVFAGQAAAQDCELTISGNDQIQFNKSELTVSADCEQVTLTLNHVGQLPVETMGHNWVLTETNDFQAVAQAGMAAGMENNYVPPEDERVIAHTELVGGGESTSITFDTPRLEAGGDYTFFCSFPGHSQLMNGKFIVQ